MGKAGANAHTGRSSVRRLPTSITSGGPDFRPPRGTRACPTSRRSTQLGWHHDSPILADLQRALFSSRMTWNGITWHYLGTCNRFPTDAGWPLSAAWRQDLPRTTTPRRTLRWWDSFTSVVTASKLQIPAIAWYEDRLVTNSYCRTVQRERKDLALNPRSAFPGAVRNGAWNMCHWFGNFWWHSWRSLALDRGVVYFIHAVRDSPPPSCLTSIGCQPRRFTCWNLGTRRKIWLRNMTMSLGLSTLHCTMWSSCVVFQQRVFVPVLDIWNLYHELIASHIIQDQEQASQNAAPCFSRSFWRMPLMVPWYDTSL